MRVASRSDWTGEPPGLSISRISGRPFVSRNARSINAPNVCRLSEPPREASIPCISITQIRGARQKSNLLSIVLALARPYGQRWHRTAPRHAFPSHVAHTETALLHIQDEVYHMNRPSPVPAARVALAGSL